MRVGGEGGGGGGGVVNAADVAGRISGHKGTSASANLASRDNLQLSLLLRIAHYCNKVLLHIKIKVVNKFQNSRIFEIFL